jgi:hypothetical protein
MTVYAKDEAGLAAALPLLADAVTYGGSAPEKQRLIWKVI